MQQIQADQSSQWPTIYQNRRTKRYYIPHHDDEARFVYSDRPRYALLKGGEGSGKTVSGCIKSFERLRRGMSGIMVSPDFEHFRKSLWREFRDWCPWHMVTERYRYMGNMDWQPSEPFIIPFINGAELLCGGIKEDRAGSWEGPNVHFFHFDEAQGHKTPIAFKVLAGRARLAGPNGEPPQGYFTTIPRKNWLYDYFGPIERDDDPYKVFKEPGRSLVVTLRTADNAVSLAAGHESERRSVLTESEARRRMDAEWEDESDAESFLPHMSLWDACQEPIPPLRANEPVVVALDAAKGRANQPSDCFAMVAVSRHWQERNRVAVRAVRTWQAAAGKDLDFDLIERELLQFFRFARPLIIVYDPTQLHQMAGNLRRIGNYWVEEFQQGADRLRSDKLLYDLIIRRGIAHDGDATLRQHIQNADQKPDADKLRIVKRTESGKIDCAVALSMGCFAIEDRFNL